MIEILLLPSITKNKIDDMEQRNTQEAIRWKVERGPRFVVDKVSTEKLISVMHRRTMSGV